MRFIQARIFISCTIPGDFFLVSGYCSPLCNISLRGERIFGVCVTIETPPHFERVLGDQRHDIGTRRAGFGSHPLLRGSVVEIDENRAGVDCDPWNGRVGGKLAPPSRVGLLVRSASGSHACLGGRNIGETRIL